MTKTWRITTAIAICALDFDVIINRHVFRSVGKSTAMIFHQFSRRRCRLQQCFCFCRRKNSKPLNGNGIWISSHAVAQQIQSYNAWANGKGINFVITTAFYSFSLSFYFSFSLLGKRRGVALDIPHLSPNTKNRENTDLFNFRYSTYSTLLIYFLLD